MRSPTARHSDHPGEAAFAAVQQQLVAVTKQLEERHATASETASARPKLPTNLPRVAQGKRQRASEKRAQVRSRQADRLAWLPRPKATCLKGRSSRALVWAVPGTAAHAGAAPEHMARCQHRQ